METVVIDKNRYEELLKTEKLFKSNYDLEDFENPNFLGFEEITPEDSEELNKALEEDSVSLETFLKELKNV